MFEIRYSSFIYCLQTTSSPPPQKKETVPEKKEEPKSVIESTEKSEVSRRDSVSYESKKDRPELKSSVMAKKSERKLYPEPQVERKVSVEAVKPVVEVIKEEVEEEVKVLFNFLNFHLNFLFWRWSLWSLVQGLGVRLWRRTRTVAVGRQRC